MKQLLRFGFKLARLYWRVVRPLSLGVVAIVLDEQGRILLVRHSYREGWYLPGGGVKRGENVLQAIQRELKEETGIVCVIEPEVVAGPAYGLFDFKHDHKMVFLLKGWQRDSEPTDSLEIEELRFFSVDDLPPDTGTGTRRAIRECLSGNRLGFVW